MGFREAAGYASFVLTLLAGILYVGCIVRRKVMPVRTTWVIWAFGSVLLALNYNKVGAQETGWMAWAFAAEYIAVAVLSIWYGKGWEVMWTQEMIEDLFCAAGTLGCALLFAKGDAHWSLYALMAIDGFGSYRIYREVRKDPTSEPWTPWIFTLLGCLADLVAVDWYHPTFAIAAYPVYMLAINGFIVLAFRPKPKTNARTVVQARHFS